MRLLCLHRLISHFQALHFSYRDVVEFMDLEPNWRKVPKTAESREENSVTQPLRSYQIFNNPLVVTEGWYPVLPSRKLKKKKAGSVKIGSQRVVVFRGEDGAVRALDAFCPHMGADLGRGEVVGNEIRCYFHRWKFNSQGELTDIPCQKKLPFNLKTLSYPVEEKYGFIWVYAGTSAPYPVPQPPSLEGEEVEGHFLLKAKLFVHHHVLMASAIDLQHFASVHDLQAEFQHNIVEKSADVFQWNVKGILSLQGLRSRAARWLLGPSFNYQALFAGGSIVSLTYGPNQTFRGKENGKPLPSFHVMWGCRPEPDGLSEALVFVIQKKKTGVIAKVKSSMSFLFTVLLLAWLKDDDVKAFPRMRFQAQNLIPADASVARFIQVTEKLKRSFWSYKN